jgi:hypothetical protein
MIGSFIIMHIHTNFILARDLDLNSQFNYLNEHANYFV